LLHVTITTRVDIDYDVMRIAGYFAAPTAIIFEGLEHTMRHLYFFHHLPIVYPRRPLNNKSIALHWGKGTDEFLPHEYGTVLVSTSYADYARDICDRRSITFHMHLFNRVIVAWECKKQAISTLHSTGSENMPLLASGVKKTNQMRDFMSSLVYPVAGATPALEDSQGTIRSSKASHVHDNTRHLATKMLWLNEQYVAGIIKLMYTKTTLQLADVNTKPLCGKHLQAMLSFLVGVWLYPQADTNHFQPLYLECCQLLKDYIHHGRLIPISSPTSA
jgi:hypothetical protein